MFAKKVAQMEVRTNTNGEILIIQEDTQTELDSIIQIHPEQVDILIEWLIAAKESLNKDKA